ncbi:MAG: 6,7-dimethyl-8-ribityllumazine synthase [Actinobacteria bacterium]|nr:6,7-dimethyl-8-ribityllumazine synthase [Actinomycetota bacterium]
MSKTEPTAGRALPDGRGRRIAIVSARFYAHIADWLERAAATALAECGVAPADIALFQVPGAFELPLAAQRAFDRGYEAVVALGTVIRGETAHFEYVAGEAASGLQLAALETGVPVAFGVLTTENLEQAMARTDKGAEAVRSALEMADLFNQLRATAKAAG